MQKKRQKGQMQKGQMQKERPKPMQKGQMQKERPKEQERLFSSVQGIAGVGKIESVYWKNIAVSDCEIFDQQVAEAIENNEIFVIASKKTRVTVVPENVVAQATLFQECDQTRLLFDQSMQKAGNQFKICLIKPEKSGTTISLISAKTVPTWYFWTTVQLDFRSYTIRSIN